METNIIIELINTIGFPIAACIALYYMNVSSLKKQEELLAKLQNTLDNNTRSIDVLISEIRGVINK